MSQATLKQSRQNTSPEELYRNRRLMEGHPLIGAHSVDWYLGEIAKRPDHSPELDRMLGFIEKIRDIPKGSKVLVVGCGPRPDTVEMLLARGFDAVGLEPVPALVAEARKSIESPERILAASAEDIPLPTGSQQVILAEAVMEHVDSPEKSLSEMARVLAPGGILYIYTVNRLRFSPTGKSDEFNVPFYNWLPDLVKESFVFQHLHYDPELANFTSRPGVHWYSYADLCRLGRRAGFSQFYSPLDLADTDDRRVGGNPIKRFILRKAKYNPWLRALALSQFGNTIIMCKRP